MGLFAGRRNSMRSGMTRRSALKTAALATTALVAAPYVRGANAAGKLSIGFWDHWVPNANKATEDAVKAWAEKEKVEVSMDFIPSQGNKNLITIAAESQASSGHDIFAFPTWYVHAYAGAACRRQRRHGRSDQAERRSQRHRQLSRQGQRQVVRDAGDRRLPDQGPVLAHRPDEAACRHRRAGAVSGGTSAEGRQLDLRHLS